MTDLATSIGVEPSADISTGMGVVARSPMQPTTLITERQVLLGSAAALVGPRVRRHRILAALQALFVRAEAAEDTETRKTPKHYPRHYSFIEEASMSRMMGRL
jgi:hypothetical protein